MRTVRFVPLLLALALPTAAWAGDDAPTDREIAALRAKWERAPGDVTAGIRLQDAMRRARLTSRTRKLFREASEAQPRDLALRFLYGRARDDARGLAMMHETFAQDLGHPEDTRSLISAAIALTVAEVAAGHGAEAEAAATRVTELRGGGADWVYLGWIRQAMRLDVPAAIEAYAAALRADERTLRARTALVGLLLEADRKKEALALATRGVELHPRSSAAHLQLGLALAASRHAKKALTAYADARRLATNDARALTAVASAYARAGKAEIAGEVYAAALAVDPEHGGALTGAGLLAMEEGRLGEARDLLERAKRVRPKDARVAFLQGTVAQRLGLETSAVNSFRRAYDLQPDRPEYLRALALAYLEKGSLGPAIRMLKRAIKNEPEDAGLRLQLGVAWMKRRSYPHARDAFEEAAARDAKDPRPYYYLAIIYGDKLGKGKAALAALEHYKERGGKDPRMLRWLDELRAALNR